MLRRLVIRNFAIIESLELNFNKGLSVLTGETGAGKSIIVGALNLVLGGRTSSDVVRTDTDEASVTAVFDPPSDDELKKSLIELGADDKSELILRRQVQHEGRSRAWLNDQPVTIGTLGGLAERLIDISGQRQHQSLLQVENHLKLLDKAASLEDKRAEMATLYANLLDLMSEQRVLERKAARRQEREDFLRFQLDELDRADVRAGEEDKLESERNLLRNSEKIREGLSEAERCMEGDDGAGLMCVRAERALAKMADLLPESGDLANRLGSLRLDLEDVSQTVRSLAMRATGDPKRLDEVESRLALLSRLMHKHGETSEKLLKKRDEMRRELKQLGDMEFALKEIQTRIERSREKALKKAEALSVKRKAAAKKLAKKVKSQLFDLGMNKTSFVIRVEDRVEARGGDLGAGGRFLSATGIDDVEFLISPNPGEVLRPLIKIASGGELSRVMLAVKSVLLDSDPVEVTVFDEVDAGISGAIAQEVGGKIRELASARQVLCITHLPQIAAFGEQHFKVEKENREGRTYSYVQPLIGRKERIEEIARLMSGARVSNAYRKAAEDLLKETRKHQLEQ